MVLALCLWGSTFACSISKFQHSCTKFSQTEIFNSSKIKTHTHKNKSHPISAMISLIEHITWFLIFNSVRANYFQSSELKITSHTNKSSDPPTYKQLYSSSRIVLCEVTKILCTGGHFYFRSIFSDTLFIMIYTWKISNWFNNIIFVCSIQVKNFTCIHSHGRLQRRNEKYNEKKYTYLL